jgi:hypothetical protein
MDSCKVVDMIENNLTGTIVPLKVIENMRPIGRIPENESQVRPLTSHTAGQPLIAWQKALEPATTR